MNDRARTTLLLTVLLVIGAVVVVDTLRPKGDADAAPADARAELVERHADRVALVEREDAWTDALAQRAAQWDGLRATAIAAATPELAVADFRALLLDEARA
ncbi:MAG: hypothetical protein AAGH64_12985, partial [Planctomycetota bacterium]